MSTSLWLKWFRFFTFNYKNVNSMKRNRTTHVSCTWVLLLPSTIRSIQSSPHNPIPSILSHRSWFSFTVWQNSSKVNPSSSFLVVDCSESSLFSDLVCNSCNVKSLGLMTEARELKLINNNESQQLILIILISIADRAN
jgi:hypothetical protein